MAKIEWSVKAQNSLDDNFNYTAEYFGEKTAQRFYTKVFKKITDLETFPEIGFPEPLLSKREEGFRACIVQKPIKMVYHYDKDTDTVYIDNFWDMRRNPESLEKDI
jgi:plasmid stabilization system protein ParE